MRWVWSAIALVGTILVNSRSRTLRSQRLSRCCEPSRFALRALGSPSCLRAPNTPTALILLLLLLPLLSACTRPGNAAPVVKLGVIAPFEGSGRAMGYAVLPGIKAAVAEANAAGAFGSYRVTVVAFNDNLDPATAAQQAIALALDPDVIGVVGPFSPETTAAAAPVLARSHVPSQSVPTADPVDQDYSQEQAQAAEAARNLLQILAADIQTNGRPTRVASPTP